MIVHLRESFHVRKYEENHSYLFFNFDLMYIFR